MAKLFAYNYRTHELEPHQVPDDWRCSIGSEDDPEAVINCADCGCELKIRDACTGTILAPCGLGLLVCRECHHKERKVLAEMFRHGRAMKEGMRR